jgi:hypothetical protein
MPLARIIGVIVICAGCASRDSGYKVSNETVAFIQLGVTTRAEVVENLGTPLFELKEPHVAAYSWGKLRATGGNPAAAGQGYQRQEMGTAIPAGPVEETGLIETQRWIYCLRLDAGNRVTRAERIKLEGATSLEDAVRKWAGSNSPH